MEKLGWIGARIPDHRISIRLDERGPERGEWTFTLGAPVTGVVPDRITDEKAPAGTLFYGRVYKTDPLTGAPLGQLRVIYDHVEFPGKGKYPVCVVSGPSMIGELKDDKATAASFMTADPVTDWAPPHY
jgi:eukaryotic-like serine/threonine-protein kinase